MPVPPTTPDRDCTLLLVRHGATAHTAQGRFSGSTGSDPELSDVGRRHAELLAAELRRLHAAPRRPVDAVVSSPVRRARETAAVVADELGLPVQVDDDLREIDFGAWEGRTLEDVRARWGEELAGFRADARVAPPGGESVADVAQRVRRARDRFAQRHPDGAVLVVSHLYPVRLWVLDALGAPLEAAHRMEHEPTAVSEVRLRQGVWTLFRYNDSGHLRRSDLPR
jgi:ribonuclease H / adenosylcobalamin/alpha-ribazole phosphatase